MTLPGYWMNETSGVLKPVVVKYLEGMELDPEEIRTMRVYLRQWINGHGFVEVDDLRARADGLSTTGEIRLWLRHALRIGIDPL